MEQNISSSSKKALTLFVMIFSLIFFFCFIEGLLRVLLINDSFYIFLFPMGRDSVRTVDPYLSWALKPGKKASNPYVENVTLEINEKGFRDDEFEDIKPLGTYRIFCMGDSTTFAMEVNSEDTYPNILERILNKDLLKGMDKGNEADRNITRLEVINAGTPGYSSLQGLVFLKRKVLKYKPDMIMVCYGFNDYTFRKPGMEDKNFIGKEGLSNQLRYFLGKTMVYTFIKRVVGKIDESHVMLDGFEPVGEGGSLRVEKDDYIKNLEEIVRLAREHGIKVVFISISNPYRITMGELASRLGVPFFSTTTYFENMLPDIKQNPENYDLSKNNYDEELINSKSVSGIFLKNDLNVHYSRYFFIDVIHPNGFGHELIGRELARKIVHEWRMIGNR